MPIDRLAEMLMLIARKLGLMEGARHMCFVDRHELFYGNVYRKRSGPAE